MNDTGPLLLTVLAGACYVVGAVAALADLSRQGPISRSGVPATTLAGLLCSVGALVWRGLALHRWPVFTAGEALLALSACTAFVYLCVTIHGRLKATQALFLPALVLIVLSSLVVHLIGAADKEIGEGALIAGHVLSVVGAATAYTAAFVGGALYLMHSMLLHRKQLNRLLGKLPDLETLENFNYRSAAVGFPLLTIAVLTGFIAYSLRAEHGADMAGSVKIVLASAVWAAYGVLIFFVPRFRARLVAQLNVAGFFVMLTVLLTARFAFAG
jgi:ABC-type uncharacterized transport system permease subunit